MTNFQVINNAGVKGLQVYYDMVHVEEDERKNMPKEYYRAFDFFASILIDEYCRVAVGATETLWNLDSLVMVWWLGQEATKEFIKRCK